MAFSAHAMAQCKARMIQKFMQDCVKRGDVPSRNERVELFAIMFDDDTVRKALRDDIAKGVVNKDGSLKTSAADPEPDSVERSEYKKKEGKRVIRNVLINGLALTGIEPAQVSIESSRAQQEPDRGEAEKSDLLGWPKHKRWSALEDSFFRKEALQMPGNPDKNVKPYTLRQGIMRDKKVIKDEQENFTAARMVYVRVPQKLLPLSNKSYYFHHGPLPGSGSTKLTAGKPPSILEPCKRKGGKAEDAERRLTVGLKDLRTLQDRTRSTLRYLNVISHSLDIMGRIALGDKDAPGTAIPREDLATTSVEVDQLLARDTLAVCREALSDAMALNFANEHSHTIVERSLVLVGDAQPEKDFIDDQKLSAARLAPNDSDTYLFGSEKSELEELWKVAKKDKRPVVSALTVTKPDPQPSSSGTQSFPQSFRSPLASSRPGQKKKGSGYGRGYNQGNGQQQGNQNNQNNRRDSDQGHQGGRGRGRGGKGRGGGQHPKSAGRGDQGKKPQ